MNDLSNTNCIPSGTTQAKLDRERVERLKAEPAPNDSNDLEVIECGLPNPCQFGAHNPNFNPNNF